MHAHMRCLDMHMGFSTLIDSRDQTRHTRTPQYASVICVGDVHCSQQTAPSSLLMPICQYAIPYARHVRALNRYRSPATEPQRTELQDPPACGASGLTGITSDAKVIPTNSATHPYLMPYIKLCPRSLLTVH